jgi:D-alanine--poly(phosphoribitol) ligase subunit 1
MDLLGQIDSWSRQAPDRLAHISGGRVITYGELARRSRAVAAYLADRLPDDRSPVAVLGHKEPEMLVAFLGAVSAGHPYIPLDTSLPAQRVDQIVAAAGARVTLTPELVAGLAERGVSSPDRRPGPADPYYIIFTSGSTGEPKGVVITLGCLTSFVTWMLDEQGLAGPGELFLNQAPFSFDLSVMDLYLSLATGGTLFSIASADVANPRRLYETLAASNITTWVSTPSFARMCLAERSFSGAMLPRLRRFLFCGETLAPEVAGQLLERFPAAAVWNTYGPTEATVATTSVRIDREILAQYSALPVGYPKPGTQILLTDESGRTLEPGTSSEIVICGPNVSPGYLGRPDLTKRSFFTHDGAQAYRTGDKGHFRDGMLFFEGRLDNQIKLHGYRVELGDVETHLHALPNVRDAVVVVKTRRGAPDSLVAFVVLNGGPGAPEREIARALNEQLAQRLPVYMLPRRFRFLDALPMTANGKADRRKLAESLSG